MQPQEDPRRGKGAGQTPDVPLPEPETVTLRDGSQAIIRPIRPDDAPRLQALFDRLSPESIFFRFLGRPRALSDEQAQRLATVDYRRQMAWVATAGREPEGASPQRDIIGVARYAAVPEEAGQEATVAEAAVIVEDRWQRRGLGTMLLQRLVDHARAHGIDAFQASVHQANRRILRFVRRSGLPTESKMDDGMWEIRVSLEEA